jgi:hypothetical protein
MDMTWITQESKTLHDVFMSLYYAVAGLMLAIGVVTEYFKAPIGGVPAFGQLLGRTIVATVLLASYPEIANAIAEVANSLASKLGDLNQYKEVLDKAGSSLEKVSWSWGSVGDAFVFVISYLAFFILHVTVYFFDAAIIYAWMLLYIFSPLLIVLFIHPVTAPATGALFRSLFEVSAWKIVWSVLGTLLWSSAVHNFDPQNDNQNFITQLTFTIILSLSVLCTPIVVRSLLTKGVAGLAGTLTGAAGTALVASAAGPASMSALATAPTTVALTGARKVATMPIQRAKAYIKERRKEESQSGVPQTVAQHKRRRLKGTKSNKVL